MSREPLSRRVRITLVSQLVMTAASFMALPLLGVYLARELHFAPLEVGTTLTIMLVSSRALPILTGAVADRFGYRWAMSSGVALRAVGFAILGLATAPAQIAVAALLVGVGGALYDPAANGALAVQPAPLRPRIFAIHTQVLNLAVILGPALGAVLLGIGVRAPFLGAAACFAVLAVVLHRAGPIAASPDVGTGVRAHFRLPLGDRSFIAFCLVMVLWWVLFSQLSVSLPIRIADIGDGERWVSALLLVNGAAGLIALIVVQRLLATVRPARLLVAGYLFTGAGLALVSVAPDVWWVLGCVAVYTVGETLLLPSSDLTVAGYADGRAPATFFGVYALSWAIGGSVGNYLGSWLSAEGGERFPWLLYGAIAVAGALAIRCVRLPAWRRHDPQAPVA